MSRLLGIATVLACAVLMLGSPSTSSAAQTKAKKPPITLTGCVQKGTEAGTYNLSSGGRTYQLLSPPAGLNLADHVGHKVTIVGTSVKPKKAAKLESKTGTKDEPGDSHLNVRSLKMVAASCS